ncbi:histone-lysine N-methyltransferase SUVR5-like isoform X1 [Zingiber officinale]|uniref:Histone-lysine N-methyltransferase SUVR5 n=1 Tax=Zingiber officinale TaxID=94328 RepID=A0A8J5GGL9_ZINOF|nr:histone-lysine N-methyltransferase SUVR5-like isoform X1 [Zingiber officinale]KAG6504134.1 hypothetical protein ZIOFF_036464 [Zingiber officinale]
MHIDDLEQCKVEEDQTNRTKGSANHSVSVTYIHGYRISDIHAQEKCSFDKEDCNNMFSSSTMKLHSSSDPHFLERVSYFTLEKKAELVDRIASNDCISTKDDKKGETDGSGLDMIQNTISETTCISHSLRDINDQPRPFVAVDDFASVRDFKQDNIVMEKQEDNHLLATDSSSLKVKQDDRVQNENQVDEGTVQIVNQEGELGTQRNNTLEPDHPVALWVKWRGKWQTGIQCPQADCPLSAIRAKPTHERKRYIPIFFPRSRTYSWTDMLLVCSINELPEPLVRGTHRKWRKLVKDLTIPRRHVMQKLAVTMLNISDHLHIEAVIENVRKAAFWKEFAREVSQCRDYPDFGRMLLMLQTMILPCYIDNTWLLNNLSSWKDKCQNAQSAGSIETLIEELMDSIFWVKINELWNAPMQPELGPEWKTWRQDAMKLFFSSPSTHVYGNTGPNNVRGSLVVGNEASGRYSKLEICKAEICATPKLFQNNVIEVDFKSYQESVKSQPPCKSYKFEELHTVAGSSESQSLAKTCNGFVDDGSDVKLIQSSQVDIFPKTVRENRVLLYTQNELEAKEKYRQCQAFVLSKGRQCGRWASDGHIYCCAHLNVRNPEKLSHEAQTIPLEAPMCKGTTTHGRNCKHHARQGSTFCKKHQLLGSHGSMHSKSHLLGHTLRGGSNDNLVLESSSSSNMVHNELTSPREIQTTHENLIPVVVGITSDERDCLMKTSELYNALPAPLSSRPDLPRCIGSQHQNNDDQCLEYATRHTLYCNNHLPKFLKRARNGRSRLVSKDIFLNLLNQCSSRREKLCLHQACELLYGFMKISLSCQRPVSRGDTLSWILSEAMKDPPTGDFLLKLVASERDKLSNSWGFNMDKDRGKSSWEDKIPMPTVNNDKNYEISIKCKICAEVFADDHTLGIHWTQVHKKEARWLFRGYACAVCMTSFTNRKVVETHVKERHGMQFLENSIIFRCMSCNSHFVSSDHLWQHILSCHSMDFRLPNLNLRPLDEYLQPKIEINNIVSSSNNATENHEGSQKFTCKSCGLRFDLLPDLGRHHQVAHMNRNSTIQFPQQSGNHHLKRNRNFYPRFKKNFEASKRYKGLISFGMPKHNKSSHSIHFVKEQNTRSPESLGLGLLLDIHCSGVAETFISKIQKTKPRPSSPELLSVASSACCRTNFHYALKVKYGFLPENVYLKALKLCSEQNIQVGWHLDGFICPKGCKTLQKTNSLAPLLASKPICAQTPAYMVDSCSNANWEMDESHYILNPEHLNFKSLQKGIILCEDVSFGKEAVPITCVVDEYLKDSFLVASHEGTYDQEPLLHMPWKEFKYITKQLIGSYLSLEAKDLQLGCNCPDSMCYPESCSHIYLFDADQMNAKDATGNSMHCRFAYDKKGRIVLEKDLLVQECNSCCKCDATCPNRVLQNGVQIKLEIFRTEKKGWAVRAGETISRGTFICEYIGEVLNVEETNTKRYDSDGCSYIYDISAHVDGTRQWIGGMVPCVIDATKHGNVSRFINHSCSPNLVDHLVFVESMDIQLAHIGLYASRDIVIGEELSYDYRTKLLPGEGHPCHCEASNCRGRLY